jgi:hypothetical protein
MKILDIIEAKARQLLSREFANGIDPHGNKWRPLSDGSLSHLTRSGALKSSVKTSKDSKSVTIVLTADHAVYHQNGTKKMPQRQILPTDNTSDWTRDLEAAVLAELINELEDS